MLNIEELKVASKVSFDDRMKDVCRKLTSVAWPRHIAMYLEEINEIIAAGKELQVTEATPFTEEEIAVIAKDLSPLRELKMSKQCREYLRPLLATHSIDPICLDDIK